MKKNIFGVLRKLDSNIMQRMVLIIFGWLLKEPLGSEVRLVVYFLAGFSVFLGRRTAWMLGSTPP